MNAAWEMKTGPELDAAICRRVFKMPASKVAELRAKGRLPKYSADRRKAMEITWHFLNLWCGEKVRRFDLYFAQYVSHDEGMTRNQFYGGHPALVCRAALFAYRRSHDIRDQLVMDTAKRMQAKAHNPGFVGKINNVLLSSPDIGPIKP